MKIGILSDCHLGIKKYRKQTNMQNTYCLINNNSFKESINGLIDNGSDVIIIAGDLFDSPNPDIATLKFVNDVLSDVKIPIFILGGNHDYSQLNESLSCHAFELIQNPNCVLVYKDIFFKIYDDVTITMVPYKFIKADTFNSIREFWENHNEDFENKTNILIFHGYLDFQEGNDLLNEDKSEYSFPKEIAAKFDVVISGHVHLANTIKIGLTSKKKDRIFLSPGALMPSTKATNKDIPPSYYVFDSETYALSRYNIENAPKVHNIFSDDINKTLQSLLDDHNFSLNDVVSIKYNGKVKDIDEYLYKNVFQKALSLSIVTSENINLNIDESSTKEYLDFWSFIKNHYLMYYDEFKNVVKGD